MGRVPRQERVPVAVVGERGAGGGGGSYVPLEITAGVNLGFDNNVLGSNATTGGSGRGSLAVGENLVLTYDRHTRTHGSSSNRRRAF